MVPALMELMVQWKNQTLIKINTKMNVKWIRSQSKCSVGRFDTQGVVDSFQEKYLGS